MNSDRRLESSDALHSRARKKFDARSLSTEEQALLRKLAVRRVLNGESPRAVTASFGLGKKTIYKWLKAVRENGEESLSPRSKTGRAPTLKEADIARVVQWIISSDPAHFGASDRLWTRHAISQLIRTRLNVTLGLTAVGELLQRISLSPKSLINNINKSQDAAIVAWREEIFPEIKRVARKIDAEIFWLDLVSLQGLPVRARAPRVHLNESSPFCTQSLLKAMSNGKGFCCSPSTEHPSLAELADFLIALRQRRGRPVFVIIDPTISGLVEGCKSHLEGQIDGVTAFTIPSSGWG